MPAVGPPSTNSAQASIDAYLAELHRGLRPLPPVEATDIVEEIRSYIRDDAGGDGIMTDAAVNAALNRLGPASALAASYVSDSLLSRAQGTKRPWTILHGMFHWAMLSVKGFFAFLLCLLGYMFGASFFIAAVIKPFNPNAGLWLTGGDNFSLVLGFTQNAQQGRELLGWTLFPIGLALGGGTVMATTYFAQWCMCRFRETRQTRAIV